MNSPVRWVVVSEVGRCNIRATLTLLLFSPSRFMTFSSPHHLREYEDRRWCMREPNIHIIPRHFHSHLNLYSVDSIIYPATGLTWDRRASTLLYMTTFRWNNKNYIELEFVCRWCQRFPHVIALCYVLNVLLMIRTDSSTLQLLQFSWGLRKVRSKSFHSLVERCHIYRRGREQK